MLTNGAEVSFRRGQTERGSLPRRFNQAMNLGLYLLFHKPTATLDFTASAPAARIWQRSFGVEVWGNWNMRIRWRRNWWILINQVYFGRSGFCLVWMHQVPRSDKSDTDCGVHTELSIGFFEDLSQLLRRKEKGSNRPIRRSPPLCEWSKEIAASIGTRFGPSALG